MQKISTIVDYADLHRRPLRCPDYTSDPAHSFAGSEAYLPWSVPHPRPGLPP